MDRPTIIVVEDDEVTLEALRATLEDDYRVIPASSGEQALEAAQAQAAQLMLLDVHMPGIDGYETCRRLRETGSSSMPVLFVSAADRLEDRLKGYEAGGDDYIVKPVIPEELLAKAAALVKAARERHQLREMADYAGRTAMTAMTSMGEMGVLLQALQNFNSCSDLPALAAAATGGLAGYGLKGVVRLRTPGEEVILSTQGAASPVEVSVVAQVAGMGRMVEYRSRLSVSYDSVTLLVSNLPLEDGERCGRLRDHLAVLAEAAEGRARAIHRDGLVRKAVAGATGTLSDVDQAQRHTRLGTSQAIQAMTDALERAYIEVGLTEAQEDFMAGIVAQGLEAITASLSAELDVQQQLTAIVRELAAATAPKA